MIKNQYVYEKTETSNKISLYFVDALKHILRTLVASIDSSLIILYVKALR